MVRVDQRLDEHECADRLERSDAKCVLLVHHLRRFGAELTTDGFPPLSERGQVDACSGSIAELSDSRSVRARKKRIVRYPSGDGENARAEDLQSRIVSVRAAGLCERLTCD